MARKKQKEPIEINLLDNHRYTVNEKAQIVSQIEQGILSFNEALVKYKIASRKTLYSWIATYAQDPSAIRKTRKHSYSHRRQVAVSVQAGLVSVQDAARQNSVSEGTIKRWLELLGESNLENKTEATMPDKSIDDNTKFAIEALKLKVAALETMIDLAEQKFGIDIRKKCGTKQQ
jgi:transposase-like protein